jgi:hypothetical protein
VAKSSLRRVSDLRQIFAVINAAFLPPIYLFYPETKGLTLEAVDLLFSKTQGATTMDEVKADTVHREGSQVEKAYELDEGKV